jgi:hypothetical protein
MIRLYQGSNREGPLYITVGICLLIGFFLLIGFSIYKNRLKERKINQEISKGVQAIVLGLEGDCSSLNEAKKIFLGAARSRIWLNREISWIGFCEDIADLCGKNHEQLEKKLKQIIELGDNKIAQEAKSQLALVQIWQKNFSASEQLLKDLTQGKKADPRAEQYLLFVEKIRIATEP